MVHILLFTNNPLETYNANVAQRIRALFANNPSVAYKHAPKEVRLGLQAGANLPMKLGFEEKWFRDYDWVIRINPDVLIRNSTFLLDAMKQVPNTSTESNEKQYKLDAILHKCTGRQIHTDFMAFRPAAVLSGNVVPGNNNTLPFSELVRNNHELTAAKAFESILNNNRYSQVIDAAGIRGFCRIRGQNSSVFHYHNSCNLDKQQNTHSNHGHGYGDLVCDALKEWKIS